MSSFHHQSTDLDAVVSGRLDTRPRNRLAWMHPAELLMPNDFSFGRQYHRVVTVRPLNRLSYQRVVSSIAKKRFRSSFSGKIYITALVRPKVG